MHKIYSINDKLLLKCCSTSSKSAQQSAIKILKNMNNLHSLSCLINICSKTKRIALETAVTAFHSIATVDRDIVCVAAMLKCYIANGSYQAAISLFEQTQLAHDDVSNVLYLKACINDNQFDKGMHVIESCVSTINDHSTELINTIIDFYGNFGKINDAANIFDSMPASKKDIVSFNAMMKCFVNNNLWNKAQTLFEHMDIAPNDISNVLYLKACMISDHPMAFEKGLRLIEKYNAHKLNQHSIEFVNMVMDFYGHYGKVQEALRVFNAIRPHKKDTVSLNTMLTCYLSNKHYQDAIATFESAEKEKCDDISNILFLKACMNADEYVKGKQQIERHVNGDICCHTADFIVTTMEFYGQSGETAEAVNVFNSVPKDKKTVSCMNSMMKIYNANREWDKSLSLFYEIQESQRDIFSYSIALNSCAGAVSLSRGLKIIADLHKPENIHVFQDCTVQAAVIRFYAKTKQTRIATEMFENMDKQILASDRTGIIHQSIMDCYAKIGATNKLLALFEKIQTEKRINISNKMYSIVLSGCSHSGLVHEAIAIFNTIASKNDLDPEIIVNMLDCYGRKNMLNEAQRLYDTYKYGLDLKHRFIALLCLLASCRVHHSALTAEKIFDEIRGEFLPYLHKNELIDTSLFASAYVLMSNIYGQTKNFEMANQLRIEMKEKGIKKEPGISWMEIDGVTHTFGAGDISLQHPEAEEINKQRMLLKQELIEHGHCFDESVITRELTEHESVEQHLCGHSEKSALIYGLMKVPKTETIVIAKNLRVCKDCHQAMKIISKVKNREIALRDKSRWHEFRNGECSCNDYF